MAKKTQLEACLDDLLVQKATIQAQIEMIQEFRDRSKTLVRRRAKKAAPKPEKEEREMTI